MQSRPVSRRGAAGAGLVALEVSGVDAVFRELSYSYPLKLLSPRCTTERVGVAYVLNYGGGLVGGDAIDLAVDVGQNARLLLLSQGTTKVFKRRDNNGGGGHVTRQRMEARVAAGALLCLLPEPATCFRAAAYEQAQTFRLADGASAVILDALTAGRVSRGEQWDFALYSSLNEVWLGATRLARDAVRLQADAGPEDAGAGSGNADYDQRQQLRKRLQPYSCYATVILVGPLVQPAIATMQAEYGKISQMRRSAPPDFLWSLSIIEHGAAVVRVAATETEAVRTWLRGALRDLRSLLGEDAFHMAFGSD